MTTTRAQAARVIPYFKRANEIGNEYERTIEENNKMLTEGIINPKQYEARQRIAEETKKAKLESLLVDLTS